MEKWIRLNEPYNAYLISDYGNIKNIKNKDVDIFTNKNNDKIVKMLGENRYHYFKVDELMWFYFDKNIYKDNDFTLKVIDMIDKKEYFFKSISQASIFLNKDKRKIRRALDRKNGVYSNYQFIRI